MSTQKYYRHRPRTEEGFEDGIDPRRSRRRRSGHGPASGSDTKAPDRKALQLCRQIAHTLGDVLAGDCDDEVLCGLDVVGVIPAPDASRLLVTLAPNVSARPCPPDEVLSKLNHVAGLLRSEVASAITRRKAPTLIYQVVPNPCGLTASGD